jgi:hypothetical protein
MLASRSVTLPLGVTRQYKSTAAAAAALRGHGQKNISRLNNAGQLTSKTQTRFLTRSIESSKGGMWSCLLSIMFLGFS